MARTVATFQVMKILMCEIFLGFIEKKYIKLKSTFNIAPISFVPVYV